MATSYPSGLDNFNNPTSTSKLGDSGVIHHQQHANANDAIEAMQTKLGIDNSSVVTSIDYRVRYLENNPTLPSQNGNSGKFLTTNGSVASWAVVSSGGTTLPTYESGKYLTNNGTTLSWATIDLSTKLNTSDFTYSTISIPVYNAVGDLPSAADNHGRWAHVHGEGAMYYAHAGSWIKSAVYPSLSGQSGKFLTTDGTTVSWATVSGGGATVSSTDQLPEGTSNLYFTNERAQDAIDTLFANGNHTGITVTYSDVNNSISLASTGSTSAATSTSLGTVYGKTNTSDAEGQTLIGYQSGNSLLSTTPAVLIGYRAGYNLTSGSNNTAVGRNALLQAGSGTNNTAVGAFALRDSAGLGADYNVAIGSSAGLSFSGSNSVFIGPNSGTLNTSGSNNIIIGYSATSSGATVSNEITLGDTNISRFRIPGLGIDWTSANVPSSTSNPPTINTKTANYSVLNSDMESIILADSASQITITLPLNATQSISNGKSLNITQYGNGSVKIVGESGVTVLSNAAVAAEPVSRTKYSGIVATKIATNTWIIQGDIV